MDVGWVSQTRTTLHGGYPCLWKGMSAAMMRIVSVLFGCLLVLSFASAVRADDPDWKVGLAQVKITPEYPAFLAGYASRNKPFEKVATDLYAKALALEDRN